MHNSPRLFVSYAHSGMDSDVFDMLIADLEGDGSIEVLTDRRLRIGDDIEAFMALIRSCHCVLMLCTPEYGRRVKDKEGGVYEEYKAIVRAYDSLNEQIVERRNSIISASKNVDSIDSVDVLDEAVRVVRDERFAVLPLLLSGNMKKSVPKMFQTKLFDDLSAMVTIIWQRTGKRRPQTGFRNKYDRIISQIRERTKSISRIRAAEDAPDARAIFDKLFFKLKHDAQEYDSDTLSKILVKTNEFKRVKNQSAYILIGRKGSGKSTLTDFLAYGERDHWESPTLYYVNEFPMELLYAYHRGEPHRSDRRVVLPLPEIMSFAWLGFFHYCCLDAIRDSGKSGGLSQDQEQLLEELSPTSELRRPLRRASSLFDSLGELETKAMATLHGFFSYCLVRAFEFVNSAVDSPDNAVVSSGESADYPDSEEARNLQDLVNQLTAQDYLLFLFGEAPYSSFLKLLRVVESKFFIAIDGMDSKFQRFRRDTHRSYRDTDEFWPRIEFEESWLEGLVSAVHTCKSRPAQSHLAGKIDFCVTIPRDRYIELKGGDRDAYVIEDVSSNIRWSGVELAILLRKRIEAYKATTSDKDRKMLDRLKELLATQFPGIPQKISILVGDRIIDINVFQYVLRHTFWRPRDILLIWARIISTAEYFVKRGLDFSQTDVKTIVARNLDSIITLEFLGEFVGTVPRIAELIGAFDGSNQILTFDEFAERLKGINLSANDLPESMEGSTADRAMEFLYKIGFVGFWLMPRSAELKRYDTQWIYTFNEGDEILGSLSSAARKNIRIVLHPMFIEHLGLVPYKEQLVCDFPDEYLVKQDIREMANYS